MASSNSTNEVMLLLRIAVRFADKNVPTLYIKEQLGYIQITNVGKNILKRQVILSEGVFFVFISLSQLLFIFEKKNPRLTERCFFSEFSVVGGQICVF